MKKTLLSLAVVLLASLNVSAQSDEVSYGLGKRVGVGVGVGTEGIGIDAAVSLNKYFSARVGVNFIPSISFSENVEFDKYVNIPPYFTGTHEGNVDVDLDLKRTTFDVKVDFYPFPNKSSFFITGGFSFGGNEIIALEGQADQKTVDLINKGAEFGIDLGGYEYLLNDDNQGKVRATAEVNNFRPYIGIGFGRLIPKNRIGVRFEAGVQFQGKPKLLDADGKDLMDVADDVDHEVAEDISDILDYMKVYPCIKLSIRGRIF